MPYPISSSIPGDRACQHSNIYNILTDTIKVGDTVVDSYWDKNTFNVGMFKVASVDGNNVVLNGVNDLTYKQPKQSLTLADRVLSISEGNSVTLPSDNQTLSLKGNTLSISNGNSIELPASVEPKEYRARGNGLLLDADGTFHIEMANANEDYCYPSF